MNSRTHINQELQSIAPGLISIPIEMPYHLPNGYFIGLDDCLLSFVKDEERYSELFFRLGKKLPYTVPQGYFEALPGFILHKVHTLLPVAEVDIWSGLPQTMPYTVPAGFFENFPQTVLQKINRTQKAGDIPVGYFESLPDTMLAKVRKLDTAKELDDVAPLLNTISKQPVQHVPPGYFESLNASSVIQVFNRVGTAPVVPLKVKSTWLKYAVAASVILLLTFGAYFLFNTNKATSIPSIANQPTVNVINDQLAKLDASAIEDYLKSNNAIVQTALPEGGVDELNSGDLDELLQGFTDKQLKDHLDETPDLPAVTASQHHT